MYWIPTTIKKKWLDLILSGEKKIEHKAETRHWEPRMTQAMHELANGREVGISFLCGRVHVKFHVIKIEWKSYGMNKENMKDIDGVMTKFWYDIHLGDQIQ